MLYCAAASASSAWSFSALQRAENSSIVSHYARHRYHCEFQCSSASRKFLNDSPTPDDSSTPPFQCSSASRKFLNYMRDAIEQVVSDPVSVLFSEPKIPQFYRWGSPIIMMNCFSALQRAENSSIPTLAPASIHISDRDDHASSFLSLPGASP